MVRFIISYIFIFWFFKLMFEYSCLHFPTTAFPCPSHPPTPPTLNPTPFGLVQGSFIHVPWWPFPFLFPNIPLPSSLCKWIKKLWYIYTMEYYTEERNKELLLFTTAWMELESITLSEVRQEVKDKYHMISPISRTWLTKQTRKQNITRDIEIKNKLTGTKAEVEGYNGGKRGKAFQKHL